MCKKRSKIFKNRQFLEFSENCNRQPSPIEIIIDFPLEVAGWEGKERKIVVFPVGALPRIPK